MSDEPRTLSGTSYRSILAGALLCLLGLLATAGFKSYSDLAAAKRHEVDLEQRIEATRRRIEKVRRQVDLLKDDPQTLERMAREDLGMVRPGDVVIILPPADEAAAKQAP